MSSFKGYAKYATEVVMEINAKPVSVKITLH